MKSFTPSSSPDCNDMDILDYFPTWSKMDIGAALRDSLKAAHQETRLTCGVDESAQLLEMDPDNVMLCLLPANVSDDDGLNIHFTLIEAFCLENEIRLLRVDSVEKLAKILNYKKQPRPPLGTNHDLNDNEHWGIVTVDHNCVLIQWPENDLTEAEEDLMEFHKLTCECVPTPIVELQV